MDDDGDVAAANGVKATQKASIMEKLNGINQADRINFLVNRLVNVELDTKTKSSDSSKLREQTARASMLEKKLLSVEIAKTKLEELCRQLSAAKKEDASKMKQMEQTHREALEKFKQSFAEMQHSYDAKKERATKMHDVEQLSATLAKLSSEYETRLNDLRSLYEDREQGIKQMVKTKDEELTHLRTEVGGMKDQIVKVFEENVDIKRKLMISEQKIKDAVESELKARQLIDTYTVKYDELMTTVTSSNTAFDKARNDMTKMNGQLIKLQGEVFRYKSQLDTANKKLIALSTEKLDCDKKLELKDRQLAQLKELCRRLQKDPTAAGESTPNTAAQSAASTDEDAIENVDETPESVVAS